MKPIALAFALPPLSDSEIEKMWIGWFIFHVLHRLILFAVLAAIAATAARFIIEASRNKTVSPNIRAVAAAVLPVFAGVWIFMYWRSLLTDFLRVDTVGIVAALVIGFAFSFGFGPGSPITRNHNEFRTVVGTFLCASLLTMFVFAYAASRNPEIFRLYYALAAGFLIRVTLFGVPRTCYRYRSKVGKLEIRPKMFDQYVLYFNDARKSTFISVRAAVIAVRDHSSGVNEWDQDKCSESPDDIADWEEVPRW